MKEQDIAKWRALVPYIAMFPGIKPSSVSTKVRVVSKSALVNAISGLSLNNCICSGPDALQEILSKMKGEILASGQYWGIVICMMKPKLLVVQGNNDKTLA